MNRFAPTHLLEYLERGAVLSTPEKVAFRDGERHYSFRDVRRIARAIGALLRDFAPDANSRPVVVFLPKSAETLLADLGIWTAGHFYVNVDIQAPSARLGALLESLEPLVVLTLHSHLPSARNLTPSTIPVITFDAALAPDQVDLADDVVFAWRARVIDTDPACIIHTSGSTGTPKSAVLTHRGLIDFMEWHQATYPLTPEDVVGSLSPYHFDGYVVGFLSSIWLGSELDVVPTSLVMFPLRLAEHLRDHGVSFIFWVPTVMVNIASSGVLDQVTLPRLRHVGFAGEVFPTRHLNIWRAHLPLARFVNYYGPIEISIICTHYEVTRSFNDEEPLPIGFPCANTSILLLDDDNRACPPGSRGELCVRGAGVAPGYWRNPDATARAFVQNPLHNDYPEIIYRTGDIAHMNEAGELMFDGRKDYQIKHLGNRIELAEIENACLQIPSVRNACVLYQHTRKEITLFYEADTPLTPASLRNSLAPLLPKVMWPTIFHLLPEMPRNPNGKIDRKALADQLNTVPRN